MHLFQYDLIWLRKARGIILLLALILLLGPVTSASSAQTGVETSNFQSIRILEQSTSMSFAPSSPTITYSENSSWRALTFRISQTKKGTVRWAAGWIGDRPGGRLDGECYVQQPNSNVWIVDTNEYTRENCYRYMGWGDNLPIGWVRPLIPPIPSPPSTMKSKVWKPRKYASNQDKVWAAGYLRDGPNRLSGQCYVADRKIQHSQRVWYLDTDPYSREKCYNYIENSIFRPYYWVRPPSPPSSPSLTSTLEYSDEPSSSYPLWDGSREVATAIVGKSWSVYLKYMADGRFEPYCYSGRKYTPRSTYVRTSDPERIAACALFAEGFEEWRRPSKWIAGSTTTSTTVARLALSTTTSVTTVTDLCVRSDFGYSCWVPAEIVEKITPIPMNRDRGFYNDYWDGAALINGEWKCFEFSTSGWRALMRNHYCEGWLAGSGKTIATLPLVEPSEPYRMPTTIATVASFATTFPTITNANGVSATNSTASSVVSSRVCDFLNDFNCFRYGGGLRRTISDGSTVFRTWILEWDPVQEQWLSCNVQYRTSTIRATMGPDLIVMDPDHDDLAICDAIRSWPPIIADVTIENKRELIHTGERVPPVTVPPQIREKIVPIPTSALYSSYMQTGYAIVDNEVKCYQMRLYQGRHWTEATSYRHYCEGWLMGKGFVTAPMWSAVVTEGKYLPWYPGRYNVLKWEGRPDLAVRVGEDSRLTGQCYIAEESIEKEESPGANGDVTTVWEPTVEDEYVQLCIKGIETLYPHKLPVNWVTTTTSTIASIISATSYVLEIGTSSTSFPSVSASAVATSSSVPASASTNINSSVSSSTTNFPQPTSLSDVMPSSTSVTPASISSEDTSPTSLTSGVPSFGPVNISIPQPAVVPGVVTSSYGVQSVSGATVSTVFLSSATVGVSIPLRSSAPLVTTSATQLRSVGSEPGYVSTTTTEVPLQPQQSPPHAVVVALQNSDLHTPSSTAVISLSSSTSMSSPISTSVDDTMLSSSIMPQATESSIPISTSSTILDMVQTYPELLPPSTFIISNPTTMPSVPIPLVERTSSSVSGSVPVKTDEDLTSQQLLSGTEVPVSPPQILTSIPPPATKTTMGIIGLTPTTLDGASTSISSLEASTSSSVPVIVDSSTSVPVSDRSLTTTVSTSSHTSSSGTGVSKSSTTSTRSLVSVTTISSGIEGPKSKSDSERTLVSVPLLSSSSAFSRAVSQVPVDTISSVVASVTTIPLSSSSSAIPTVYSVVKSEAGTVSSSSVQSVEVSVVTVPIEVTVPSSTLLTSSSSTSSLPATVQARTPVVTTTSVVLPVPTTVMSVPLVGSTSTLGISGVASEHEGGRLSVDSSSSDVSNLKGGGSPSDVSEFRGMGPGAIAVQSSSSLLMGFGFSGQRNDLWAADTVGVDTNGDLAPVAFVGFTDHLGSPHQEQVEQLAYMGITQGCNPPFNTRFCPDRVVSRGEMATFLVRALSLPATSQDLFIDDDASSHEGSINSLAAAGLTAGCNPPENTRFCPGTSVTRAQMATFLARGLRLDSQQSANFADIDGSSHSAHIAAILGAGITQGCNPPENTRYCPDRPVTRAEMATFLIRALAFIGE